MVKNIVYLTQAQWETLTTTGYITVEGVTHYYDEDNDYRVETDVLTDAPSDNKQYARKNGDWEEVQSGGITNYDLAFLSLADNTTSFTFPANQQCHRKVRIVASATLNFAVDNKACNYVRVYNSGSSEITLTIGAVTHNSTAVSAKVGPAEIKCGVGKYVEISVIYDGSDATFTASDDLQILN